MGLFCLASAALLLVVGVRRNILIVETQLNIMWFMHKCFKITAVQGHYKVIIDHTLFRLR